MPLDATRVRALCFDVDGTLNDTDDQLVERLAHLIVRFHKELGMQVAHRLARKLVMRAESPINAVLAWSDRLGLDEPLGKLRDAFSARLRGKQQPRFMIIPGVKPTLERLASRYPLAVVSARDRYTTMAFLETYELLPYFRCVATAHTCKHTKPFPDPILWAAEQMNVPPEACVMVGDTTVDILAGKAAGSQTVGVLCGFGEWQELIRAGADLILPSTNDLSAELL
jgi:HAD superfamily hydrolase (TIGR01509 family)